MMECVLREAVKGLNGVLMELGIDMNYLSCLISIGGLG